VHFVVSSCLKTKSIELPKGESMPFYTDPTEIDGVALGVLTKSRGAYAKVGVASD
jgi:hypothetical protein